MKFLKLFPLIAALFSAQVIAAPPVIFSGNDAKLLKKSLDFNGESKIISGSIDPTSVAVDAPTGSLYLSSNGNVYKKTDSGLSTNWTSLGSGGGGASWGSITGTLSDQTDLQSALDAIEGLATDAQDDIDAHIADSAGAHAGTAISNAPAGGISATTIQAAIDELDAEKQPLDAELTAVAGLSSNGLIARTGAGTAAVRTVTGTANQITVTNGDGVSGNPTISIPSNPTLPGGAVTLGTSGPSIQSGTVDPTVTATSGEIGSLYLNTSTGITYQKFDSGSSTNWRTIGVSAAITPPVAFTPTIGAGAGTVTNNSAFYQQIGNNLRVYGSFTTGTVAGSLVSVSLPGSLTLDTSRISIANTTSNPGMMVGRYTQNGGSGNYNGPIVTATGTSTSLVYLGANDSASTGLTPANGSANLTSSNPVSYDFIVPVSGLASVVNTAQAAIVTAESSYTATFQGFGTVSSQNMRHMRIGEFEYIQGVFTIGTPTTDEARVSLPPGCTSASTYGTLEGVGTAYTDYTTVSASVLMEPGVTYMTFGQINLSGNPSLNKVDGDNVSTAGTVFSIHAKVKCAGYGGTIPAPTDPITYSALISAPSAGTCAVTEIGGKDWISGNATSGGTGSCVFTFIPGIFGSTPGCTCTSRSSSGTGKICMFDGAYSSSTVTVLNYTAPSTLVNTDFVLTCTGAR